jgi:hypothetical protein
MNSPISKVLAWQSQNCDAEIKLPPNIAVRVYLRAKLRLSELQGMPKGMDELENWIANAIDQGVITVNNCPELFGA